MKNIIIHTSDKSLTKSELTEIVSNNVEQEYITFPETDIHPDATSNTLHSILREETSDDIHIVTWDESICLEARLLHVKEQVNVTFFLYEKDDDERSGIYTLKVDVDERGVLSDWLTGLFQGNLEIMFKIKKLNQSRDENR